MGLTFFTFGCSFCPGRVGGPKTSLDLFPTNKCIYTTQRGETSQRCQDNPPPLLSCPDTCQTVKSIQSRPHQVVQQQQHLSLLYSREKEIRSDCCGSGGTTGQDHHSYCSLSLSVSVRWAMVLMAITSSLLLPYVLHYMYRRIKFLPK